MNNELEGLELENDQAYVKGELFGEQGSGKTFTASTFAIGLHKYIKSEKPVYFQDTETGSAFVKHMFKKEGIRLVGKRSKTFADLMIAGRIAERNCDIMIVDSITHVWVDLCEAYRKKKYGCEKCGSTGRIDERDCFKCDGSGTISDRLAVWDYQPIKKEWAKWVDFYLNSRLHFFVCGRAGGKYESRENLEGKTEIIKVEEKMKAESEFGYEASLLIQMKPNKVKKGNKVSIENTAFIWKDRFNLMNGHEIKMPTFEDILPHINLLNLGGLHVGNVDGTDTVDMLKTPKTSSEEYFKLKTIRLEEIQGVLLKKYPSTGVEDKKGKALALEAVFNTLSWTAVESLKLDQLNEGYERMVKYLDAIETHAEANGKAHKELVGGKK